MYVSLTACLYVLRHTLFPVSPLCSVIVSQIARSQQLLLHHACQPAYYHAPHHDGHGPSGTVSPKVNAFFYKLPWW